MKAPGSFREALISVYRENPCQVLPNALWKSTSWVDQFKTNYQIKDGVVRQLIAWDSTHLMIYWDRDRDLPGSIQRFQSDSLEFVLLHHDFIEYVSMEDFNQAQSYFRLVHQLARIPEGKLPSGYSFSNADPLREAGQISDLISACYEEIRLSPDVVQSWQAHPVFEPDLWVWIIDEIRGSPIGLGIAEFDSQIAEGTIEWIQVLPEYRRHGWGKQIVKELLRRLEGRAAFVTVAGKVDNLTQPEKLYRSCGFEGNDIWWVLRK